MASEAIDKHEMDAKLYLLRAKLSFKIVRRPGVQNIMFSVISISLSLHNFMEK